VYCKFYHIDISLTAYFATLIYFLKPGGWNGGGPQVFYVIQKYRLRLSWRENFIRQL
jgi:hypothetical protein